MQIDIYIYIYMCVCVCVCVCVCAKASEERNYLHLLGRCINPVYVKYTCKTNEGGVIMYVLKHGEVLSLALRKGAKVKDI